MALARRSRCRGATLLELTCALFVLTLGAFGALQMHFTAMDKTGVLQEYAYANQALRNEIETLRALPFKALENGEAQPFHSETPVLEFLMNARTEVDIAGRGAGTPGLKEVRVRIAWTGEHGRTIRKEFTTLIANRGDAP